MTAQKQLSGKTARQLGNSHRYCTTVRQLPISQSVNSLEHSVWWVLLQIPARGSTAAPKGHTAIALAGIWRLVVQVKASEMTVCAPSDGCLQIKANRALLDVLLSQRNFLDHTAMVIGIAPHHADCLNPNP